MKWKIIALTVGRRVLGEVEADDREAAVELGEELIEGDGFDISDILAERILGSEIRGKD